MPLAGPLPRLTHSPAGGEKRWRFCPGRSPPGHCLRHKDSHQYSRDDMIATYRLRRFTDVMNMTSVTITDSQRCRCIARGVMYLYESMMIWIYGADLWNLSMAGGYEMNRSNVTEVTPCRIRGGGVLGRHRHTANRMGGRYFTRLETRDDTAPHLFTEGILIVEECQTGGSQHSQG